ncbi:hypothetical protein B0T17DRAFT_498506 [Bombardia bombarda]|uniref:AHC1-like C2H2 zinc-finger domain-containing protein n=1 Tax=Bombardia bombarda TaxID=252184 RepID=A0AA39WGK3_9PEZI|nr:hypothetical protein B0T17DRAFT_498506 [Bombardia bombarda]
MFRFWSSDTRGSCEKTFEGTRVPVVASADASGLTTPITPVSAISPSKRRRPSAVDTAAHLTGYPSSKRIKVAHNGGLPSPTSATADDMEEEGDMRRKSSMALDQDLNLNLNLDLERAKDVIQYQFGLEILLKHDELRLINQELAKCQVALEQLRRCHLMPYPVQCPMPGQMLDISSGKGAALQSAPGQAVPKWAPPFGVVEGPYARHYAKWLIPDPVFDGIQPETRGVAEGARAKSGVAEGRTTRNSMPDATTSFGRPRPARGQAGQKLHALSSGYPQPKDKQAPCVLKRSDGLTVKLVCIDCHRWDFSSTQGFINHCRIAHRRDFKSHEEAAVHCGHPIDVDENGGTAAAGGGGGGGGGGAVAADEPKPCPAPGSVLVHPWARNEAISDQQAYKALRSRISASLALYRAGKLPHAKCIPRARSASLVGSSDVPYLTQLMQKKKIGGNLKTQVTDAKTKMDWDVLLPGEDCDDTDQPSTTDGSASPSKPTTPSSTARTLAVMRVPTRSDIPPPPPTTSASVPRPSSSKSHVQPQLGRLDSSTETTTPEIPETPMYDDEMDVELSPNTITSNNAPSLVSDDGEYDDSDDGSASDTSDEMDAESVSDIAEINIDDDVQDVTPRPIHHCRAPTAATAVKLKKDENRHVTFVTPLANSNAAQGRRKPKV